MKKYQRSECKKRGWLHKFKLIQQVPKGNAERCERCGEKKLFPPNTPNHIYLSYHIRDVLRANDSRFKKEYPNIQV